MRVDVYKETKDDWYPEFQLTDGTKLVRVSFTQTGPDPKKFNGEWRVCVWGDDDCGMERDYQGDQETECWNMFLEVIGLKTVDVGILKKLGFVSA